MKITFAPAIAELTNALRVVKTNEPINRKEGNVKQANLERFNAKAFRAAIEKLKEEMAEKK